MCIYFHQIYHTLVFLKIRHLYHTLAKTQRALRKSCQRKCENTEDGDECCEGLSSALGHGNCTHYLTEVVITCMRSM